MDVVQDWAAYILQSGYVTPSYLRPFMAISSTIQTYLIPAIERVIQKPDLATIALMLLILFLSLKLLNMLWQAVMFWVRLATRIVFWGGLIVLGFWLANRGAEGAMEDVGYWTGVWKSNYEHWKDQAESAKLVRDNLGTGGARRRGW
ncbi:hypothetical protein MBLNU459_g1359t1 [Dothideomycetes sp. NU459]